MIRAHDVGIAISGSVSGPTSIVEALTKKPSDPGDPGRLFSLPCDCPQRVREEPRAAE